MRLLLLGDTLVTETSGVPGEAFVTAHTAFSLPRRTAGLTQVHQRPQALPPRR